MPSWFEKKNGKEDDYYNMGFPTEKEAYDYAKENNLEIFRIELTHDQWILWFKYR